MAGLFTHKTPDTARHDYSIRIPTGQESSHISLSTPFTSFNHQPCLSIPPTTPSPVGQNEHFRNCLLHHFNSFASPSASPFSMVHKKHSRSGDTAAEQTPRLLPGTYTTAMRRNTGNPGTDALKNGKRGRLLSRKITYPARWRCSGLGPSSSAVVSPFREAEPPPEMFQSRFRQIVRFDHDGDDDPPLHKNPGTSRALALHSRHEGQYAGVRAYAHPPAS